MNGRIAVDLAGGCLKDLAIESLREAEHVNSTMNRRLRCLNRVVLIVDGRCWAGQVKDLIYLNVKWKRDIMSHEFKMRMTMQMLYVALCTCKEIV